MTQQNKNNKSPSRDRLIALNKQEEYLSEAFKIDNFYKDEKLDVLELKTKIQQIRQKKQSKDFFTSISHEHKAKKSQNKMLPFSRQIRTRTRYQHNSIFEEQKNTISGFSTSREKQYNPQSRLTKIPKINSIGRRQGFLQTKKPRHTLTSNRLEPIKQKSSKIQIRSSHQLEQFEQRIQLIWTLYEELSSATKTLSEKKTWERDNDFINLISKYQEIVCSSKFQFLVHVMEHCLSFRQSKVLVHSRLLQNLSIIYIFVEIGERIFNQTDHKTHQTIESSHMVNFVGICSNNLLLLIRLIILIYHSNLELKPSIVEILTQIALFEKHSYQEELLQVKNVLLRMEHNNELISIIQQKLNQRINKDFQVCINKFLKNVERIQKEGVEDVHSKNSFRPFYEFSYYIFQYLAYHLHTQNYIGLFPHNIETAPDPYLPLRHQFTIIINPIKVFLFQKKKIYVRAYTEKFLADLSKKCNIVFWVEQIPSEADPLIKLIPNTQLYHKLYRHHCMYVQMDKQVYLMKFAARVKADKGKYIILDGDIIHYPHEEQHHLIDMGWKGEDDKKLLGLLDLLLPCLREGADLLKILNLLRPKLEELQKKKRKYK